MRRRTSLVHRRSIVRLSRPRLHLFFLYSALILGFTAVSAAQDTTPPPPPDAPASQAGQTPGQNNVRAVRLSDVEGQVQVFQGDQLAFDQASANMPAVQGMRFVTAANGRVEIEFEDGSVARVTPNSSISLTQLARQPDGSTVTRIEALTGLTYYELNSRGGSIAVQFGRDTATPEGSAVFRIALDAAPDELAVMHGSVHIDDGQGVALDVHPNQSFQLDPQQPSQYTVAQSISADSWDQWNSDRDQALAELESSETNARASSGDPNDPSWNDLDYYGNWYNLPGYGQIWSPVGVGAGWDPFGVGAWGYYGGFGYTWISGYPWGWWPYHCGAWDYFDGFGWGWIPGNCGWGFWGAGWYPYATVWRVPKGYVPPPRPRREPLPGPRPQPVVKVDRGEQYIAPFHFAPGQRPAPRPLLFDGKTIAPIEASIHPLEKGPTGESFTATLVRSHPELATPAMRGQTVPGFRSTYTPPAGTRSFGGSYSARPAPGGHSAPSAGGSHISAGGGGGGGHASAPASSGGGSTHH